MRFFDNFLLFHIPISLFSDIFFNEQEKPTVISEFTFTDLDKEHCLQVNNIFKRKKSE